MFAKTSICFVLFLFVQKTTFAEWVEVPQFSDDTRVYRVPFNKHDRGHKFFLPSRDGPKVYGYGNASSLDENLRRKFKQPYGIVTTTPSTLSVVQSSQIVTTRKNIYLSDSSAIIIKNSHIHEDQADDVVVEIEEEPSVTVPTTFLDDKITLDGDQPFEPTPDLQQSEETTAQPEIDDNEKKPSFLAFIPIELFKKVHAILQSQSTTVEGKIHFLQNFEKTLLNEIEKRLVPALNPVRKKRESRGDHGWDDHHEKGIGFPSLEGALMAIAFLTFAVYLVQLVMMLFRNLGNPAPTSGTATVLFNRNRRSVDQLTEDTARILGYLDEFAKNENRL